jgi:tetratricopeptide (TPR) repeat protein
LHEAIVTPGGCEPEGGRHCDALEAEISHLSLNCPTSPEIVMASALLAFQSRQYVRAQQLLDELFALQVGYPEAVSLRARIALQEGNVRFALRFLKDQLQLFGDNSGVHETYASALYLAHLWSEAREQLAIAARLGAPSWRVQYGLGLIEEAQSHFAEAKQHYDVARQERPDWKPPQARLRALIAEGKITP